MRLVNNEKKNDFVDRRLFARFPVKLPLRFLEKGKIRKNEAQTVDISAIGIGFISKKKLSPDTLLEIWLDTPDRDEPLYIVGRVVWSKRRGVIIRKWRTGVYLIRVNLIDLGRVLSEKNGLTKEK